MFKNRSDKKELLDQENIPENDLYLNLKELNVINHLLGGYSITFNALNKILDKKKSNTLVDIGSGGGDTLKEIHHWAAKNEYNLKLFGIDLKQSCINYSNTNQINENLTFICDDYRNASKHILKIDIVHACLFCHHLTNENIIQLIKFCKEQNAVLVINDLERNPIAYYAIKWLTYFFSKSYLVKNDAPLSVLRGFKKREWVDIIKQSGATKYSVKYKWAFRHEVIVYAN